MGPHIFDKKLGDLSVNELDKLEKQGIIILYLPTWKLFRIKFQNFKEFSIDCLNGWEKDETINSILNLVKTEFECFVGHPV